MLINKEKKSQTITKNKTVKNKRYMQINIFNFAKPDIYLVVFSKFIYLIKR